VALGVSSKMGIQGWTADYPAASNFLTFFRCGAPAQPSGGFCDRRIDAMIDQAIQVQANDPVAAGALWAKIDRAIVDQAPNLWLVNPIAVQFVSERVGNFQWSLQWRELLNQLWVQ
jgi:peptide/nickel transport system substrate-binding protein